MPLIKDIIKDTEHKKKFQRKAYRPWDDEVPLQAEAKKEINDNTGDDAKLTIEVLNSKKEEPDLLPISLKTEKQTMPVENLDMEKSLRDLYGAQRVIFKFLVNLQVQELEGSFITQPISTNEIALATKLPVNTIKTVIGRLKLKKLIQTFEWKPGRGGYGRYGFDNNIYNFFIKKFFES